MHHEAIIRAWKDEAFRNNLSQEEQARLPAHPAGLVELRDEDLGESAGATITICVTVVPATVTACTLTVCSLLGGCLTDPVCRF